MLNVQHDRFDDFLTMINPDAPEMREHWGWKELDLVRRKDIAKSGEKHQSNGSNSKDTKMDSLRNRKGGESVKDRSLTYQFVV